MNAVLISQSVSLQRGAVGGTRLRLMLEYQKSPNPGTAYRASTVFASSAEREHNSQQGPRAVRRRRDFWYSSMSDGAAPPSGLAQAGAWWSK